MNFGKSGGSPSGGMFFSFRGKNNLRVASRFLFGFYEVFIGCFIRFFYGLNLVLQTSSVFSCFFLIFWPFGIVIFCFCWVS